MFDGCGLALDPDLVDAAFEGLVAAVHQVFPGSGGLGGAGADRQSVQGVGADGVHGVGVACTRADGCADKGMRGCGCACAERSDGESESFASCVRMCVCAVFYSCARVCKVDEYVRGVDQDTNHECNQAYMNEN